MADFRVGALSQSTTPTSSTYKFAEMSSSTARVAPAPEADEAAGVGIGATSAASAANLQAEAAVSQYTSRTTSAQPRSEAAAAKISPELALTQKHAATAIQRAYGRHKNNQEPLRSKSAGDDSVTEPRRGSVTPRKGNSKNTSLKNGIFQVDGEEEKHFVYVPEGYDMSSRENMLKILKELQIPPPALTFLFRKCFEVAPPLDVDDPANQQLKAWALGERTERGMAPQADSRWRNELPKEIQEESGGTDCEINADEIADRLGRPPPTHQRTKLVEEQLTTAMEGISEAGSQLNSLYLIMAAHRGNRLSEIVCQTVKKGCRSLGLFVQNEFTCCDGINADEFEAKVMPDIMTAMHDNHWTENGWEKVQALAHHMANKQHRRARDGYGLNEVERGGDEPVASVWAQVHKNLQTSGLEHYSSASESDLPCCLDPRRYRVDLRGAFTDKTEEPTLATNREEVKNLIKVTAKWTAFEEVAYRQRRVGLLQAGLISAVTHALVFQKANQVETFVSRFAEMYSTGVIVAGGEKMIFDEAVRCLKANRPLFLFKGTSGAADVLARVVEFAQANRANVMYDTLEPSQKEPDKQKLINESTRLKKKLKTFSEAKKFGAVGQALAVTNELIALLDSGGSGGRPNVDADIRDRDGCGDDRGRFDERTRSTRAKREIEEVNKRRVRAMLQMKLEEEFMPHHKEIKRYEEKKSGAAAAQSRPPLSRGPGTRFNLAAREATNQLADDPAVEAEGGAYPPPPLGSVNASQRTSAAALLSNEEAGEAPASSGAGRRLRAACLRAAGTNRDSAATQFYSTVQAVTAAGEGEDLGPWERVRATTAAVDAFGRPIRKRPGRLGPRLIRAAFQAGQTEMADDGLLHLEQKTTQLELMMDLDDTVPDAIEQFYPDTGSEKLNDFIKQNPDMLVPLVNRTGSSFEMRVAAVRLLLNFPDSFNDGTVLTVCMGPGHAVRAGDLQDKITKVMSSVYDMAPEMGGLQAEQRALANAELLHVLLERASEMYWLQATVVQGIYRTLTLMTVVVATLVAYTNIYENRDGLTAAQSGLVSASDHLEVAAIVLPLVVGLVGTFFNMYKPMFRFAATFSAAKNIESEIFRYRARSGAYRARAAAAGEKTHRQNFAEKVEALLRECMSSDMRTGTLTRGSRGGRNFVLNWEKVRLDDEHAIMRVEQQLHSRAGGIMLGVLQKVGLRGGPSRARIADVRPRKTNRYQAAQHLGSLSADDYVSKRLLPQLSELQAKAPRSFNRHWVLTVLVVVVTTTGAGFSALGQSVWVPLLLALAAMLEYWDGYLQLEKDLMAMNVASAELQTLLLWWDGLSVVARRMPQKKDKLVNLTETALLLRHQAYASGALAATSEKDEDPKDDKKKKNQSADSAQAAESSAGAQVGADGV